MPKRPGPPKPKVVKFRRSKLADSGSGAAHCDFQYGPGQAVTCKILRKGPWSYAVLIPNDNLRAWLVTPDSYTAGDEVEAAFICLYHGKLRLADLYGHVLRHKPVSQDGAEIFAFPQKVVPAPKERSAETASGGSVEISSDNVNSLDNTE